MMVSERSKKGELARLWLVAIATSMLLACNGKDPSGPTVGSETHFLKRCDTTCPTGTECLCGVCSRACSESNECTGLNPEAQCTAVAPRVAEGRCSALESAAICDLSCLVDQDCSSLGADFTCRAGYCRVAGFEPIQSMDAGASVSCEPLTLLPDDVLVLGDSLIELSSFASQLDQIAVQAGVLADNQQFRVKASSLNSMLAAGVLSISEQYAAAREQAPARLVIMDGGETDVLNDVCGSTPSYDCPAIQAAVRGAEQLLLAMVQDGVQHIAYFFYPDPVGNDAVKQRLDVLRPLIENVCGQLPIPCHWVDLRSKFADHPDYLASDGLVFSEQGAAVAAQTVWQRLQQRCVVR